MKVTPRSEALTGLKPMEDGQFTGKATGRDLLRASRDERSAAFVVVVRFEPGVRNNWHAHAGGQVLHVIDGEGWVQARGGGPQRIRVGDTVTTHPNEEHWHGAGRNGPMAHLAIGIGDTRWLEESPAPPD
jgi:quercetin dioxygenase-like cupin family protein